jgi:hypothetical protein
MVKLLKRLWDSPTFATWASFGARSAGLVFLLPLILTRLSEQEVVVFLLFHMLSGLRIFADFGFGPTFIRFIAYALGGVRTLQDLRPGRVDSGTGEINMALLGEVVGALRWLFRWMSLILFLGFGIGGTWALSRQIQLLEQPWEGWTAWFLVLPVLVFGYWATQFSVYLQGLNRVALLRRWEALFSLGSMCSVIGVLLGGGGLWEVVAMGQLWLVLGALRNWWLARKQMEGWWCTAPRRSSLETLRHVWGPAWRTGVGAGMSMGLVQLTGILFAQLAQGTELAALLLALRFMALVVDFANAPFYSKLPRFSRLVSSGQVAAMVGLAQKGMRATYLAFLVAWIGLGLAGPTLLNLIGANVKFPETLLWTLLGLAFLTHRYGAMHIQIYNTSNHVIMHIADGFSGMIYLITLALAIPRLGVLALPVAQLVAYGGFYAWYASFHSYRFAKQTFFAFERKAAIPAAAVALAYATVVLATGRV